MIRMALLSVIIVTATTTPVVPCTYEIPTLREAVKGATLIVVGTVGSVIGDSVDWGYPEPVVIPRSATFSVEEVLKGSAPSARLELLFPEDIVHSSCGPPYLAYFPGSRFVLLLGQPTVPSTYKAPGIDPWRMRLSPSADYTATPLYRYLVQIVESDISPIRVAFEARGAQRLGQALAVSVTVTNELNHPLQLWLGRPQYGHVGLGLWLLVEGVSPSAYDNTADEVGILQVAPLSISTIDLAGIFTVTEPGQHGVRGYLWVPNGAPALQYPPEAADFYDILHGGQPNLWSYRAELETRANEWTWGEMKVEHDVDAP